MKTCEFFNSQVYFFLAHPHLLAIKRKTPSRQENGAKYIKGETMLQLHVPSQFLSIL